MEAGRRKFFRNFWLLLVLIMFSCEKPKEIFVKHDETVVILLQPFRDMENDDVKFISEKIKTIYPNIKILNAIDFPENAYYKTRNRYRADSTIAFLKSKTPKNSVTLGLTSKDISATKGKIYDFGIMGLGYRPGKACIASSFRLSEKNKKDQFYKIAIHELGHTQGLEHCPNKTCFMRDAEGGNPTDEETDFCEKCKKTLIKKHWKFKTKTL